MQRPQSCGPGTVPREVREQVLDENRTMTATPPSRRKSGGEGTAYSARMGPPREELTEGQHAGVLTAPQILHFVPDRRQRMRLYYDIMWCGIRNAFGASTEKVLALNSSSANIAFVHESWERLARTELCTNCHARMDYGFQFFLGFPDSRASVLSVFR